MGEKGFARRPLVMLVAIAMAITLPNTFDRAEAGDEPGIKGFPVIVDGDWDINETTDEIGRWIYVYGNITVHTPNTLRMAGCNLTVEERPANPYILLVEEGATLVVENSTLHLGSFETAFGASLVLNDTDVATTGTFTTSPVSIQAIRTTITNVASNGAPDRPGEDALMILDGRPGSILTEVAVISRGGDAGNATPGANGSRGGRSRLVSSVPEWIGCTIEVAAGEGSGGGTASTGQDGGSGGDGGDAELLIETVNVERTDMTINASSAGNGGRGGDNIIGDGGNGGDGGTGGDATARITSSSILTIDDCTIRVTSGSGGSGDIGGGTTMASAGDGGRAGPAGTASLEISSTGAAVLMDTVLMATAGNGGWGGDSGRTSSDIGVQGKPTPGGTGGDANITVESASDMTMDRCDLAAVAGGESSGGSGYDQGGRGGDGGSAALRIRGEDMMRAESLGLTSTGGMGGYGGPAFSDIFGNGGDGANATVELSGANRIKVRDFTFDIHGGRGGKGDSPTRDGEDGTPSLVVVTHRLEMWNGTLGWRLNALPGDAETDLYDVNTSFGGLEAVLPIGNGIIRTWHTVDIVVVDSHVPAIALPRINITVDITSISTDAMLFTCRTDADGFVSTHLQSFLYTPTDAKYVGGYLVTAISPNGKSSRTVRLDVQGAYVRPNHFIIVLPNPTQKPFIIIENPSSGGTYTFTYENTTMEVSGYSLDVDGFEMKSMSVRLYSERRPPEYWPTFSLNRSAVYFSEVKDPNDRWGKYFPPEPGQNKCRFFLRCTIVHGPVYMPSGDYVLTVMGSDGDRAWNASVELYLYVLDNGPPNVTLATDLDRVDWNSTSPVVLSGTSADDHGEQRVEVRLDGGTWEAANGTYSWSFRLDLGSLAEGFHTIEVRANDGEIVSPTIARTFTIDRTEAHDGDDGGGGGLPTFAVWGLIVIALVAVAVLAAVLLRRRERPDA